jgi:hypothetical protein
MTDTNRMMPECSKGELSCTGWDDCGKCPHCHPRSGNKEYLNYVQHCPNFTALAKELERVAEGDKILGAGIDASNAKHKALQEKYDELIMAVETKFPNESRHNTALRYIVQRENQCFGPAQNAALKGD